VRRENRLKTRMRPRQTEDQKNGRGIAEQKKSNESSPIVDATKINPVGNEKWNNLVQAKGTGIQRGRKKNFASN